MARVKASVVKTGNQLEKMIADLMKAHGQEVQVGHFASQGSHSTAGIPYVALMRKHHAGYDWYKPSGNVAEVPARPIIDILGFKIWKIMKSPKIRLAMRVWGKFNFSPAATKLMMNEIGKTVGKAEQKIFGDSSVLEPNHPITIAKKGFDAPMIETSELRDKVAYKNTIEGIVREVK